MRLEHVAAAAYHMGRARTALPPLPASFPQPSQGAKAAWSSSAQAAAAPGVPASPGLPAACLASLLQLVQPDLFLASPESLGQLAQGLGYLAMRQGQAGERGAPGVLAAAGAAASQGLLPAGWLTAFCKVRLQLAAALLSLPSSSCMCSAQDIDLPLFTTVTVRCARR